MKSLNRLFVIIALSVGCLSARDVAAYQPPFNVQMQVIKEEASIYNGQPFWMAFQVKLSPGTKLGWHQPLSGWTPTHLRLKLPKPLVVTRWIWPAPQLSWSDQKVEVYYQNQFTVLAQVQWSGDVNPNQRFESYREPGQWFLQGQAKWSQIIEKIDLTGEFFLPAIRLPNEVPLSQDPLTLAEFSRIFYSATQRLDPALVDWNVEGGLVHMIIRQPINASLRWAVIPSHSRVEIPKTVSLDIAIAKQKSYGRDVALVFDNAIRKQWAAAGIDEVMIVDERGHQALVVSLELESIQSLTWLERISQWWGLESKDDLKVGLRI